MIVLCPSIASTMKVAHIKEHGLAALVYRPPVEWSRTIELATAL